MGRRVTGNGRARC